MEKLIALMEKESKTSQVIGEQPKGCCLSVVAGYCGSESADCFNGD